MALFRILAWILLLLATVALASDLTRGSGGFHFAMTSSYDYWKAISPQSLATAAEFLQQRVHPALWNSVVVRLLLLPAWFLIGALGLLLAVLGRRKRRVNIFAN